MAMGNWNVVHHLPSLRSSTPLHIMAHCTQSPQVRCPGQLHDSIPTAWSGQARCRALLATRCPRNHPAHCRLRLDSRPTYPCRRRELNLAPRPCHCALGHWHSVHPRLCLLANARSPPPRALLPPQGSCSLGCFGYSLLPQLCMVSPG